MQQSKVEAYNKSDHILAVAKRFIESSLSVSHFKIWIVINSRNQPTYPCFKNTRLRSALWEITIAINQKCTRTHLPHLNSLPQKYYSSPDRYQMIFSNNAHCWWMVQFCSPVLTQSCSAASRHHLAAPVLTPTRADGTDSFCYPIWKELQGWKSPAC